MSRPKALFHYYFLLNFVDLGPNQHPSESKYSEIWLFCLWEGGYFLFVFVDLGPNQHTSERVMFWQYPEICLFC